MDILISGATGFIGRRLGERLSRDGHNLWVLSRDPVRAQNTLPFRGHAVGWSDSIGPVDAVIHLAGEPIAGGRWTRKRKEKILSSRVHATRRILEMAHQTSQPSVLISASAIGFYGERGEEWLHETSKPGAGFLSEVVQHWETSLFDFPTKARKVALRTGLVLGLNGGALEKMLPVYSSGLGGRFGSGRQWVSWIHIEDLVEMYLFALTNTNASGVLNAVAPNPVRNEEFNKKLGEALNRPSFLAAPSFALKMVLGEMASALLESQRVSSDKIRNLGFQFHYAHVKEALDSLLKNRASLTDSIGLQ